MPSHNASRTHDYLQAVASMGSFENVADFYAPNVVIQEFPNRVAPQGRVRRAADLRAAYEQGSGSFGRKPTKCSDFLKLQMR
jgi:hypothetical protein